MRKTLARTYLCVNQLGEQDGAARFVEIYGNSRDGKQELLCLLHSLRLTAAEQIRSDSDMWAHMRLTAAILAKIRTTPDEAGGDPRQGSSPTT